MEMEEKKNMNTTKDMFKMALAVEYMPGGSNLVLRTTFIEKATPRCLLEKTFSSVGKRLLDA